MAYLIGSIILSLGLLSYIIYTEVRTRRVLIPILFDQKKYDRIQRDLDKQIAKMWELSGERPDADLSHR